MADMPNLDEISVVSDGPAPVAKKGFDWKNSNGVKIGVAVVLVLLVVLIFCVQLGVFGGKSNVANNPGGTNTPADNGQNPPPSPPTAPPAAPSSPENKPTETPQATPAPAENNPTNNPNPQETPPGTTPNPGPGMPPGYSPGRMPPGYPPGGMPPGYQQGMPPGATPGATDKPPLNEDFTKWGKKEDYVRARREGHQKLPEAVAYLGKKFAGRENYAQEFADLLKPIKEETKPADPSGGYVQPPMPASPQLIDAIVNALADNGTKPAKETLKKILTGEFITDDDRTAVEAVIKCMVSHPSEENDALLFQLLTTPDAVRKAASATPSGPGSQMAMPPSELRTKAEEIVKVSASEKIREKLADHFSKSGVDANNQMLQFLLQEDPANLGAQLILYQGEETSNETKTKLEPYFLNYASLVLGMTMSVPSGVEGMSLSGASGAGLGSVPPGYGPGRMPPGYGPGGMPPGYGPGGMPPGYGPGARGGVQPPPSGESPTSDAPKVSEFERGVKLADMLWASEMAMSLPEQLGKVATMEKSAPTIVLASTMPLDPVRAAMFKMLKKKQIEGPQVLDTAGWSDKVLNDPGTLVLVKMLNRKELKLPKGTPRQPGYAPNPGATNLKPDAQKKQQAEYDWFEQSRKLVALWCSRFEAAAQTQKKAAKKGGAVGEPAPTKLDDFEMPKDAKIEDAYQLNWPEKAPAGLTKAKPGMLKIQYFHLTQTSTIKKTMTNWKRVMKNSELHETDKGLWAEITPKTTGPSAPRRSVDVLITKQDKSAYDPTQKEDTTDLDIHVLAIEIADPGEGK